MKKTLSAILFVSALLSVAHAQQISPSGVYGAASSTTAGGLSVNWVIGTLTPVSMSALPVKLISFKGYLTSAGDADLEWKTAQESGNKGFEIQKSVDGKSFEELGWIDGAGDHEGEKTYHFTDINLQTTSYYRLKQIDHDGQSTISRIVVVIPSNESMERFVAFPNPSADGKIQVTVPDKAVSLVLVNKNGKMISEHKTPLSKQILTLPATGLYLLKLQTATGEKTLKLVRD